MISINADCSKNEVNVEQLTQEYLVNREKIAIVGISESIIIEPVDAEKAAIMEAIIDLTNEIVEIKNKLNGGM